MRGIFFHWCESYLSPLSYILMWFPHFREMKRDDLESSMNLNLAGFVFSWPFELAASRRALIPALQRNYLSVRLHGGSVLILAHRALKCLTFDVGYSIPSHYILDVLETMYYYECICGRLCLKLIYTVWESFCKDVSIFKMKNWSFNLVFA